MSDAPPRPYATLLEEGLNPFAECFRAYMHRHHKVHGDIIEKYNSVQTALATRLRLSHGSITQNTPVGIIGAGVAGLYTAIILDSLGIPFTILEQSDRVGGRLFTHKFNNNADGYQYFDVGAMRFPRTPFMKRTFELFDKINEQVPRSIHLIPYHFQSIGNLKKIQYYNGRRVTTPALENQANNADPFHINVAPMQYIPPDRVDLLQPAAVTAALQNIMHELTADFRAPNMSIQEAMARLIANHDKDSMRSYLTCNPQYHYSPEVIHLLETFDKSTGWYDRALVESVCESLAFGWTGESVVQYDCIDGGSSTLPNSMRDYLENHAHANDIKMCTRVSSISYVPGEGPAGLAVEGYEPDPFSGGTRAYRAEFAAVISSVPLSALNLIDLSECGINDNYAQYSGIRELQYGPSIKIGIQFKENWWHRLGLVGGQSFTDLPIRTVVYPSYPPGEEDVPKSRVLIASYCWTQDAERLGAFIDSTTGHMNELLLDLVLRNLEKVHSLERGALADQVEETFAFDWQRNPFTQGAFAFFAPQEYGDGIYMQMRQPAARGQLFFAGEATSGCHAWVAGALDSAWHSVWQLLRAYGYPQNVLQRFYDTWGRSEYWDSDQQLEDHILVGLAQAGMDPEGRWPHGNHAGQPTV